MARSSGGEVIALDSARDAVDAAPPARVMPAPSLRDYVGIVLKRRWVVAIFFGIVVSSAALWVWREPNLYRASATLEISPNAPRYLGSGVQEIGETGNGMYWQTKEFFETQYQIIRSRSVAGRVVDRLGLATDLRFLGVDRIEDPERRRLMLERIDPVSRVQSRVRVDPVKDSRIVRLSIQDTDPKRAALIANAYAEAYIQYNLDRRIDTTRAASTWLSDQLGDLKVQLEKSEVTLHEFKRDNDILAASFEDRKTIASQRIVALNDTLTRVRTRRAELEARARTLADARRRVEQGDTEALESIPAVAGSSTLATLKLQLLTARQEQAAAYERYLDQHPRRAEVDTKVELAQRAVDAEVRKLVRVAEAELREVADTEHELTGLIAGAQREAFEVNKREVDYRRLAREQENNQRLYDIVLQRLKEADLAAMLRTNNVQLLDSALVPKLPVKPNRKVILLVAVLIGLAGGVGLAVLFEQLDSSVKTHDDVEKELGLPFLGIVPTIREEGQEQLSEGERGRNRDLHSHRRPKSSVAECVRSVRTNLLFMTPDKPLRRLLVTSSSPQEGKTTVATNIAIAMAQSGSRVLLVDSDMRRPRVHRAFGLPNDVGLSSAILQQTRLDEAVQQTVVPNLSVLACGPIPPNPSELLHTARFKQLVQEMEGRFDRVIFDSPPVAAVTDALVLAAEVDGVVLVIKSGRTPRELAVRTRHALDDVNARIFGVVLNDVDLERRGYGYYYYYQRYGYYYGENKAEA